jgi:gamma-glutamylcyclotransferase (GGCT)/AIG2-like uncharacterized protein YtfP
MGRPRSAIYFAYGSNLDEGQLRRRCPSSKLIGPAVLRGYRIGFAGFSLARGGGVATIIPQRGARVQGLLYTLAGSDISQLDAFEGAPIFYQRRAIEVRRGKKGAGRGLGTAWTYVLDRPEAPPATPYLTVIGRAYRRLGFRYEALFEAVEAAFGCIELPLSVRSRKPGPGPATRPPEQRRLPLGPVKKKARKKAARSKA